MDQGHSGAPDQEVDAAELDEIIAGLRWLDRDSLDQVRRHARFWSKVERTPWPGCWLWTDNLLADGYGQFERGKRAHRVAWELIRGPIPNGLVVCHRCDVKRCVNPDHLFLGTVSDNLRDHVAKDGHIGRRKLSNSQVEHIRYAFSRGASQASLARTYEVCHATIHRIVHGLSHREGVKPYDHRA